LDKDKALEAAVTQIERQFGKGTVMRMGDHPVSDDMQFVPTGSLALDIALGVGGIPRGRITEVFGPESSGKTTVCQHVIAEAQARGGKFGSESLHELLHALAQGDEKLVARTARLAHSRLGSPTRGNEPAHDAAVRALHVGEAR